MDEIQVANLLALLIPLGAKLYSQIQQNHADKLTPIAELLAASDADWDAIRAKAQAQIANP